MPHQPSCYSRSPCCWKDFDYSSDFLHPCPMCWRHCWSCLVAIAHQWLPRIWWQRSRPHQLEWTCWCLSRTWLRVLPRICSRFGRFRCHRWEQTRLSLHRPIGYWIDRHIRPSWRCFLHRIIDESCSNIRNSCHLWSLGKSLGKNCEDSKIDLKLMNFTLRSTGPVRFSAELLPPFSTSSPSLPPNSTSTHPKSTDKFSRLTTKR